MLFVFLKQFSDYGSLLVVLFRSLNLVLVQQFLIELLNVMVYGNWHKEIPTVRADLILNILSEYSDKMFYTHHFLIRTFRLGSYATHNIFMRKKGTAT